MKSWLFLTWQPLLFKPYGLYNTKWARFSWPEQAWSTRSLSWRIFLVEEAGTSSGLSIIDKTNPGWALVKKARHLGQRPRRIQHLQIICWRMIITLLKCFERCIITFTLIKRLCQIRFLDWKFLSFFDMCWWMNLKIEEEKDLKKERKRKKKEKIWDTRNQQYLGKNCYLCRLNGRLF